MADKELTIEMSPQALAAVADDPELAAAVAQMKANFHQAHHAVATGQHKTFADAMEAITGSRPELVSDDEVNELKERRDLV